LQGGAPWSIAVALALAATATAVLAARRPRRASGPQAKAGARVEAAALAHDLRTPLIALWGTSEMLARLRSKKTVSGRPLLKKLVDLYAADVPGQIAQLRAAAERGNVADLQVTAHRLEGSSSAFGARALAALAADIELLARSGDATAAVALVADLEQAWPGTRDALAGATEPAAAG
jgi:HPt (histidine-containing phosphotransfer) domain-containing protein